VVNNTGIASADFTQPRVGGTALDADEHNLGRLTKVRFVELRHGTSRNRAFAAKLCTRASSASAASRSSNRMIRSSDGDHVSSGQL
jgi:hypothetical protein